VADLYIKYEDSPKFNAIFVALGILLMSISVLRRELVPEFDPNSIWGTAIFQPKLGVVLAVIGFFSLLIVFANSLTQLIKIKKFGIINSYSKGILWIYLIYMVVTYRSAAFISSNFSTSLTTIILFLISILIFAWIIGTIYVRYVYGKRWLIVLKKPARN
jgi:hypothetical protein